MSYKRHPVHSNVIYLPVRKEQDSPNSAHERMIQRRRQHIYKPLAYILGVALAAGGAHAVWPHNYGCESANPTEGGNLASATQIAAKKLEAPIDDPRLKQVIEDTSKGLQEMYETPNRSIHTEDEITACVKRTPYTAQGWDVRLSIQSRPQS